MPERTIEDRLREEYFELLPEIRKVAERVESEVRFDLLPISAKLYRFEQIEVRARIKECESAVDSLRRRQEGATFDQDRPGAYSLTSLKDLAAIRVLAFPHSRLADVESMLHTRFHSWVSDPVVGDSGNILAQKYWGYTLESNRVAGEYQIVPMLTGLFWEIEHSALYKPTPRLRGVAQSLEMRECSENVLMALDTFAAEFERLTRNQS